ncbi:DUF805 domain-containing protein [Kineosporia rhizophila]|uniref:DUF805 domain-containing protein n=1 Tax=Kineosporia TaxID=49184 RepID=UPI001E36A155|nr:DUF805 domain-containing protein [Kineosporia sp. NBRC 101677]MCE0540216.1 DUF805 domain-containing protein [Kineosporia rhizophila]GLY17233.1 DUF805 domain-containing protein [Kineosporia sp. NBRC 101677]
MSFSEAVNTVLKQKYATFSGRARRSEYWWFFLAAVLVNFVATIILALGLAVAEDLPAVAVVAGIIYAVVYLGTLIPLLAAQVRRLHDVGRSGWWMLIALVPLGSLVLLVFAVLDSEAGQNKWGPNPKGLEHGYGHPGFAQ